MSQPRISHSPDLKKIRDEGYALEIRNGLLVVRSVPYVNGRKEVKRGIIISELNASGDVAVKPGDHTVYFAGEYPCDRHGTPLTKVVIESTHHQLGHDLAAQHRFSSKPKCGFYTDYYEKLTTYIAILSSHAQAVDPGATAQVFPPFIPDEDEKIFKYVDTASSRAGLFGVNNTLAGQRIGIVGVGGTGSYILDLVAKTRVTEIHLFDGDLFYSHNAFRAPGAPSLDDLRAGMSKVAYFSEKYSAMRNGIVPHPYFIDESNVGELAGMNYVFLCVDAGDGKKSIVKGLERRAVPFIDVGMGTELVDDSLRGIVRVTTNVPGHRNHFRKRVSLADAGVNDEYERNIQIADLNALNATLAVIKWKKLCGFYLDFEKELHTTYSIDDGMLLNEDQT